MRNLLNRCRRSFKSSYALLFVQTDAPASIIYGKLRRPVRRSVWSNRQSNKIVIVYFDLSGRILLILESVELCFQLVRPRGTLFKRILLLLELRNTIISIGVPVLPPEGNRLIRGPRINVPEYAGLPSLPVSEDAVNGWADRGWIDLRPRNVERWQSRFRKMLRSAQTIHRQGSAAITMEAYRSEEIRIGEVVGWIFNNEEEGYRIK